MVKINKTYESYWDNEITMKVKIVTIDEDKSFLPDITNLAFEASAELVKKILLEHPKISHALVYDGMVQLELGEDDSNIKSIPEASNVDAPRRDYLSQEQWIGEW